MKKLLAVLCLLTSAASVSASEWDGLDQRFRDGLISGQTRVHSNRARTTRHGNESAPEANPIWNEMRIYTLINAEPKEVAAMYSDYVNFPTYFSSATLRECEVRTGSLPNLDVYYGLDVMFGSYPVQRTRYQMRNTWAKYDVAGKDAFRNTWEYIPGTSTAVFHVEGGVKLEPVEINGETKTLVRYDNYINPTGIITIMGQELNVRNIALNTDTAKQENLRTAMNMMRALKSQTESRRGSLAAQIARLCGAVGGCQ